MQPELLRAGQLAVLFDSGQLQSASIAPSKQTAGKWVVLFKAVDGKTYAVSNQREKRLREWTRLDTAINALRLVGFRTAQIDILPLEKSA